MKIIDISPPTGIYFERKYSRLEGIARKEMNKAATKKKIVSFVSNPIPTTIPAKIQSLGSFRLIILIMRYASKDHHKESNESGVRIVPNASMSNDRKLRTAYPSSESSKQFETARMQECRDDLIKFST